MTRLFESCRTLKVLQISVRYKNPPHHWSVLKKRKPASQTALDHFDDFYQKVYGDILWKNIKSALLSTDHKYIAVVNNFSDTQRICEDLENIGAMNLKDIYLAEKKNLEYVKSVKKKENFLKEVERIDKKLDSVIADKKALSNLYPDGRPEIPEDLKNEDIDSFAPIKLQSIESGEKVKNSSRIIKSSSGIAASQFYEYLPATKLKGMEDYELESTHYGYYEKGADFNVRKEKEYELKFPDKLLIYTFEESNSTKFPKPKIGSTEVLDYFALDGASILPILSLDLKPGDTLLDMCAAPGGKTLLALQSLVTKLLVSNDVQESRINKMNDFIEEIIPDVGQFYDSFFITQSDARFIEDKNIYNKILVDVPCTTDRHVLHSDDNNIFKSSRIKERLRLPEMQAAILKNALKLIIPGGTVVYSTCSMSPVQNDGVVQLALKEVYEQDNHVFIIKDQSPALEPLQHLYNFDQNNIFKHGHMVIPSKSRNWGPMYFCKMVRIQ